MSIRNTQNTFGVVAKAFHWVMFLGFVALFVIGFYMTGLPLGPEMFEQIGLHKSIGIVVLGLAVLRLGWRLINPSVALPDGMTLLERLGAHGSHIALYGVMFIMPLSGWAMSSAANFPVSVFGLVTLPNLMAPSKEAVEFLKAFHGWLAWGIIGLIVLHVVAALKHHFINKDNVLTRMMPFGAVALMFMATPVMASEWVVKSEDSKLGFFATQTGAEFEGRFNAFTSDIRFDPNDLVNSKVSIVIDIKSVDTKNHDRDTNIITADWFDAANHPTAVFETTTISKAADGGYVADAKLTMRGVSKDVKMPFTVKIDGTKSHAKGELTVNRTDFGIGQGQWVAAAVVGHDVRIFFDLKADAK